MRLTEEAKELLTETAKTFKGCAPPVSGKEGAGHPRIESAFDFD